MKPVVLALALAASLADGRQEVTATECVRFDSNGRLRFDQRFTTELFRDFTLRVQPDGVWAWQISMSHRGSKHSDYVWVVSPPFVTARAHMQIGPGYGLTASESLFDRSLNFVLNDADYEAALKIATGKIEVEDPLGELDRLGKGTLRITFTGHGLRKLADVPSDQQALDWIEFKGEACVPGQ